MYSIFCIKSDAYTHPFYYQSLIMFLCIIYFWEFQIYILLV